MPKFTIRLAGQMQTSFSVEDDDIFIGRVPTINDICVSDPSISRQHAHIKRREEGYAIYDLKSLNGVFLNTERVQKGNLKDGDEIRLGDIEILFETETPSEEQQLSNIEEVEQTHAQSPTDHPSEREVTKIAKLKPKKK